MWRRCRSSWLTWRRLRAAGAEPCAALRLRYWCAAACAPPAHLAPRPYPARLPRSTLEQYTEHVEALASQLLPPDLPAFCCGPAAQPGAALPMQQQQQADAAAGAALAALPAAPRPPAVPPPAPLARTPQLPAATHKPASLPAGVQQQEPAAAPAAGRAAQLPAVPSVRLQVQQQLHVSWPAPGVLLFVVRKRAASATPFLSGIPMLSTHAHPHIAPAVPCCPQRRRTWLRSWRVWRRS